MDTQVQTQAQNAGIAAIKPKRKYTKRKVKVKARVQQVKPTVSRGLPKTATAYLRTLGVLADKESAAVSELIRLHSELVKAHRAATSSNALVEPVNEAPKSFWNRFTGWIGK